jgi:hypothetical protein
MSDDSLVLPVSQQLVRGIALTVTGWTPFPTTFQIKFCADWVDWLLPVHVSSKNISAVRDLFFPFQYV